MPRACVSNLLQIETTQPEQQRMMAKVAAGSRTAFAELYDLFADHVFNAALEGLVDVMPLRESANRRLLRSGGPPPVTTRELNRSRTGS